MSQVLLLRLKLSAKDGSGRDKAVLSTNEYWLPPPGIDLAADEAAWAALRTWYAEPYHGVVIF